MEARGVVGKAPGVWPEGIASCEASFLIFRLSCTFRLSSSFISSLEEEEDC